MASWKIVSADNAKKVYKIARNTGHEVVVAIPPEHHGLIAAHAYVEAVKAGHDFAIENAPKKPNWFKRLFKKKG